MSNARPCIHARHEVAPCYVRYVPVVPRREYSQIEVNKSSQWCSTLLDVLSRWTGSREETRCRQIMAVESSLPFIEIPAAAF